MRKFILLSGPNSKQYYNENIKKVLQSNLKNSKIVVAIPAYLNNNDKVNKQFYGDNEHIGIIKNFSKLDIGAQNFYLLDSTFTKEEGNELIKMADIIFLMGGNPFEQLEYIKQQGYDFSIKTSSADVIGVSAGAMNLSKVAYYSKDDDYPFTIFYKGLSLVNITIEPHFDIDNKEQLKDVLKSSFEYDIIALPNESAVIVEDDNIIFIGTYYFIKNGKIKGV